MVIILIDEFFKKLYGRRAIKYMVVVRIKLWAGCDQRFGSFSASPVIGTYILGFELQALARESGVLATRLRPWLKIIFLCLVCLTGARGETEINVKKKTFSEIFRMFPIFDS